MSRHWLGLLLFGVWIGAGGVARAAMTVTPNPLDLGSVAVGQSKSDTTTLSDNNQVTVTLVATGADCPQFSISPTSVTVGQRQPQDDKDITVMFTPTSAGDKTCSVAAKQAGSTLLTFMLKGKGIPAIAVVAPTTQPLQFNHQDVNTTSVPQPVTIRNDGDALLTITSDSKQAAALTNCFIARPPKMMGMLVARK